MRKIPKSSRSDSDCQAYLPSKEFSGCFDCLNIDNSYEGILARRSGLTKEQVATRPDSSSTVQTSIKIKSILFRMHAISAFAAFSIEAITKYSGEAERCLSKASLDILESSTINTFTINYSFGIVRMSVTAPL